METHTMIYDVCRDYICDYGPQLAPFKEKLLGYLRSRSIAKLATCSTLLDPIIHDREHWRHLLQIEAMFKKNKAFSSEDCEANAFRSFQKSEVKCQIANKRLDFYYEYPDRLDPELSLWMSRMSGIIQHVLGDFNVFFEDLPQRIRLTGGATVNTSRKQSIPYMKLRRRMTVPVTAIPYVSALYRFHGYTAPKWKIVNWNRIEAVPKNYKTHRTIACEPEGVMPFQLAFDSYVKERLRSRMGINLSSQVLNQELAKEGSISGNLATIDLSAASDSLTYNCVAWLFPSAWFNYMREIRSTHYLSQDDVLTKYAKFSSMGNGCTFGLETLVFAAACKAVGSKRSTVYGDDIVIETELVEDLNRLLAFLGFDVNSEKSFTSGPFRESCGSNWFQGVDITPQYIRRLPKRTSEVHHYVNILATIGLPGGKVWDNARRLILEWNAREKSTLLLTPFTHDSTSGIWIDTPTAYSTKVLRNVKGSLQYKGLVTQARWDDDSEGIFVRSKLGGRNLRVVDSRTLALWFLEKNRIAGSEFSPISAISQNERYRKKGDLQRLAKVFSSSENANALVESSLVPSLRVKYMRKWVSWFPPAQATPVHLYWWTDYILPALRGGKV